MEEKIVKTITHHIKLLENQSLKKFILNRLNTHAKNYITLFTSAEKPLGRSPLTSYTEASQYFSKYSPLAIFYRHAPLLLTEELTNLLLTLSPAELFSALKTNKSYLFNGSEVLEQASPEDQFRLAVYLNELSGDQIYSILTQQFIGIHSNKKYININALIDIHNEKKTIAFFELFLKLDPKKILEIFQSKTYLEHDYIFIELISKPVSESIALKIIELLKKLPPISLKKIINNSHSFQSFSRENFLHPIFSLYSARVIQEMLPLLKGFKTTELYSLFEMKRNFEVASPSESERILPSPLSTAIQAPLHLAFYRRDQPEIACLLIDILPLNAFLKPIKNLAPIHCAVQTNNIRAVQLFLERFTNIPEKDLENLSHLAKTQDQQDIIRLCKIYPWYQAIQGTNPYLKDLPKDALSLNTRWSNEKTLLHMACQRKNPLIIDQLIQAGADIHAVDSEGQSPLHIVLESGHHDSIAALIKHPHIQFHIANPQGILPFQQLLQQNHFHLIQKTLQRCRNQEMTPALKHAFAKTLSSLPKFQRSFEFLHEILDKSQSHDSLLGLLSKALEENQNSIPLFIIEASQVLASTSDQTILAHLQIFITRQLDVFIEDAPNLEKETARFNLLLFLIAMPVHAMISLLQITPISAQQRTHLELTLGQVLIKPAIFLYLSWKEQREICLFMGSSSPTLKSIITIHFQKTDLSVLAPQILQYFADCLTFQELIAHSQKRHNPYLLLLCIERACLEDKEDALIQNLLDLFYAEVRLFNDPAKSQQFLPLFELISQEKCQHAIHQFILSQNYEGPLWTMILDALKKGSHPQRGTIWHNLLIDYAVDINNHPHADYSGNLALILALCSVAEVKRILSSLQFIDKEALPDPLSTWLLTLPLQSKCIQLTPFTHKAIAFSDQAQQLANSFAKKAEGVLNKALNELAIGLERLADAIIVHQFDPVSVEIHSLINIFLSVQQCMNRSRQAFTTLHQNKHINLSQSLKLIELLDKQLEKSFLPSLNQAINHLNLPAEVLCTTLMLNTEQRASISEQLTKTLMQHHEYPKIIMNLVQWYIQQGHSIHAHLWITTIVQLAKIPFEEFSLATLQPFFLPRCQLSLLCKPLMEGLYEFSTHKNYSAECLLEHLCTYKKEALLQLAQLADQALLADFASLLRYVSAGVEHAWDSRMLINSLDNATIGNAADWLAARIEKLHFFVAVNHSSQFLLLGLYLPDENNITRSLALKKYLLEHQHELLMPALQQWIESWIPLVMSDLLSQEVRSFIMNFNLVLQQMDKSSQIALMNGLSQDFLTNLLEHGLSGIHGDQPQQVQACRQILNTITSSAHSENSALNYLIKHRLTREDLQLLGDSNLIALAQEILTKQAFDDTTSDGIWIQRLLTSPRFMAVCNYPKRLIDQYCALSTCLKQEEFDNLTQFHSKLRFAESHQKNLQALEKELILHGDRREALLAKKERLLKFRAKDAVRALLNELEEHCFELQKRDPSTANAALNNLYQFYNEELCTLRSDLLFRVANFTYELTMRERGDLIRTQSTLLQWVEKELPHFNFTQSELSRKTSLNLYDQQGKKIGFVDESNHCLTFIQHEPVSLLKKDGITPGYILYDKQRSRLGTLQASGLLIHDNVFQHHTSALLVGKMPIEKLANSAALDLLMQDIFIENSLDTLYEASASNPIKQAWVHKQVLQRVAKKQRLEPDFTDSLLQHHTLTELLVLMSKASNPTLSMDLFEAILAHEDKRRQLFSRGLDAHLLKAFQHMGGRATLAAFLQKNHEEAWFHQGLSLFAAYSKKIHNPGLLAESLEEIQQHKEFDPLLKTLIRDSRHASIVLEFIHYPDQISMQKASCPASKKLASFFAKHHLLEALIHLNKSADWKNNKQYRLLLMIFQEEHARLFPKSEIRFSEKFAWHGNELIILMAFVKQHYHQKQWDDKQAICQALLGELAFKCANFGQVELFYQDQHLDRELTAHSLHRHALQDIARDFSQQIATGVKKVHSYFSLEQKQKIDTTAFLKENQAIVDWRAMEKQSWKHCKKEELPLITAFLMNYSGSTDKLSKLVADTLNDRHLCKNKSFIHSISRLMSLYSHRDFSQVIFAALQQKIEQDPSFLDQSIYMHMMQFYRQRLGAKKNIFDLLAYFGQQKHYQVVFQCVALFKKEETLKNNPLLQQILVEAKTERYLLTQEKSWLFTLKKSWMRWWAYGNKQATGFIKFCDQKIKNPLPLPKQISTPTLSGEVADARLNLVQNTRKIKEKYERFKMKVQKNQVLLSDLLHEKAKDKKTQLETIEAPHTCA